MEENARRGAPGGEPGLSPGEEEETKGSHAAGAVAAGGVVRGRRVGRGRSGTERRRGPGARGVQEGRADEKGGELQWGRTRGVGEGGGG